jgi:membrane protein
MILSQIQAELENVYQKANRKSRGVLEIIRNAVARFIRVQGIEAAAAIAYYTIFSIFPLLLLLISVAGSLLKGQEAVDLVLEFIGQILPVSPEGLEEMLRQIVAQNNVSGIVGLVGLMIAASAVFTTLARNINRAWPNAKSQNLVRAQLIAFGLIAIVATMMILWVVWTWFVSLLISLDFPSLEKILPLQSSIFNPLVKLSPLFASFLLFLIVYRWLPNTRVRWSEALWGAGIASIGFAVLTAGFSWYLRSGIVNYDLIYGSLGTSIALLTWVFSSVMIILFGAHLSAAIARATRLAHPGEAGQPAKST